VLDYHFHRGFLRRVICHTSAFVDHADSWMAQHPIRDLAIHEDPDIHEEAPHPTKLLMHPILAELECLDLGTAMWTDGDWSVLAGRDLPRLRHLVIRNLGPEAARWISGASWWPNLAQLRLERQTDPWGLRELGAADHSGNGRAGKCCRKDTPKSPGAPIRLSCRLRRCQATK
jgi:hypothetical protein